jgi:hypothetical protein
MSSFQPVAVVEADVVVQSLLSCPDLHMLGLKTWEEFTLCMVCPTFHMPLPVVLYSCTNPKSLLLFVSNSFVRSSFKNMLAAN